MNLEHRYQAGLKHFEEGRLDKAEACLRAVADANPGLATARYDLGVVLQNQGKNRPAIHAFTAAVRLAPEMATAHFGIGSSHFRLGELAEAEIHVRRSLALDPTFALAQAGLAIILRQACRMDEARAAFETAVRMAPNDAPAKFGRGFHRLLEGNFRGGWLDYESRQARLDIADPALSPQWRGSDPAGKTLLLYAEQGVGDTMQFLRYAKVLKDRGARVLAFVQIPLMSLTERAAGVDAVVMPSVYLPPFDACCPLPSLPLYCGTVLETIPAPGRYLSASPERVEHWRAILGPSEKLTVAFAWAGNPDHVDDHHRSMTIAQLAPLFRIEGVRWLSVQKGDAARALKPRQLEGDVVGLDAQIRDFDDTAAILDLADLVISVDTAVCHLAGALGRPTWTLLPFAPDWRWLMHRTDSPWYPSMRLYRQPADRDWASVVARVAADLADLAARPRPGR
jgi:tetratricopeptide (TPR) repeat protein